MEQPTLFGLRQTEHTSAPDFHHTQRLHHACIIFSAIPITFSTVAIERLPSSCDMIHTGRKSIIYNRSKQITLRRILKLEACDENLQVYVEHSFPSGYISQ